MIHKRTTFISMFCELSIHTKTDILNTHTHTLSCTHTLSNDVRLLSAKYVLLPVWHFQDVRTVHPASRILALGSTFNLSSSILTLSCLLKDNLSFVERYVEAWVLIKKCDCFLQSITIFKYQHFKKVTAKKFQHFLEPEFPQQETGWGEVTTRALWFKCISQNNNNSSRHSFWLLHFTGNRYSTWTWLAGRLRRIGLWISQQSDCPCKRVRGWRGSCKFTPLTVLPH